MTVIERLQSRGFRRQGSPARGFRYRAPDGAPVNGAHAGRIRHLAIPPGWTEVFVSPSASSAVQAIGRDRAGRWQYRYSEAQIQRRERNKRERLLAFLKALPTVRSRVARDVKGEGLSREHVLAAMVRLLLRGFLRPGSHVYARENGTYGLATLKPRHVRVRGRRITLTYPGKGGKAQVREIDDARAAKVVAALLAEPGPQVFRYRGASGEWVDVRRRHINMYLREVGGCRITAKDFRTWAGTLVGACALARIGYPAENSKAAVRRCVATAMRETSERLGNTPAVCRSSYVSPEVLAAFAKGRLLPEPPPPEVLVGGSTKLLELVERRLARLIANGHAEARRAA